ncbi:MAG: hypothetical protein WCJ29_04130 [bacterium]
MKYKLRIFAFFAVIASWFSWLNWYPGFKDGDGFYHAKLVELMRDHGVVRDFIWLPLTTLSEHFADHHFLYHALAVPLAAIFSPLLAIKILSVALGFLVCIELFLILRKMATPYAAAIIALLAIHPYFVLRATMGKGSGAAMLVQFGILACFLFRERLGVFLLSMIYVWTHAGFPYAIIIAGAYFTAKIFTRSAEGLAFKENLRQVFEEEKWNLAAVFGGILAGMIINPYFPESIIYYAQIVIGFGVNPLPRELTVGAEWYGVGVLELLMFSLPMFAVLLAPIFALALLRRTPKWDRKLAERFAFLFFMAAGTGLLTLRSNRHAEYFLPYLAIFIGEVWRVTFPLINPAELRLKFYALFKNSFQKYFANTAILLLILTPVACIGSTIGLLKYQIISWDGAREASEVIRANTEPYEIVFDGNWDFMPQLLYWNDRNRYINGLDPRFFGAKDLELALWYQKLAKHVEELGIKKAMEKFPMRIIVMPKDLMRVKVLEALKNDPENFRNIFENDIVVVFERR